MMDDLRNNCDLFVQNYYDLKKNFRFNNSISLRLGALLYGMDNKTVDVDAIGKFKKLINDNTVSISQFKDATSNIASTILLTLQSNPEDTLKKSHEVYKALKKEGFHSSPYLVIAAISIVLNADPNNYPQMIKTARSHYNLMKGNHRFITSSDDYCFCALLAMMNKPVEQAEKEMEDCYQQLKTIFHHSNALQSLSHVLTLSNEEISAKCKQVEKFYHALRTRKCKFGLGIELSFLGIILLLTEDIEKVADEIAEVDAYLNGKKGFGVWSLIDKERIMYSIALVCDKYLEAEDRNTMKMILLNDITNILRAQQVTSITAAT